MKPIEIAKDIDRMEQIEKCQFISHPNDLNQKLLWNCGLATLYVASEPCTKDDFKECPVREAHEAIDRIVMARRYDRERAQR